MSFEVPLALPLSLPLPLSNLTSFSHFSPRTPPSPSPYNLPPILSGVSLQQQLIISRLGSTSPLFLAHFSTADCKGHEACFRTVTPSFSGELKGISRRLEDGEGTSRATAPRLLEVYGC